MKILHLIPSFPVASETFVMREVSALRRLGCEVHVLSFTEPASAEVGKLDPVGQEHFRHTHYPPRHPWAAAARAILRHGFNHVGTLNRRLTREASFRTNESLRLVRAQLVADYARAHRIDRLHAHWPYASQVAALARAITGLPLSISIHAHEVEHDFGHFPALFESIDFASFCNRAALERLLGRLPASARAKAHLVYHGVDLARFTPLPFPEAASPLRVISAGRLTRTKGFDRLLRGCARYHAEGGAIELTILGQGTLADELRRMARELNFADHLFLPGWLPHDEVARRLADSHLFALLADTNFHDGLPNVVLEAMASARPVILSPLPAAPEAVDNGVEGFVLRAADDQTGLVDAFRQCADAPNRLVEMGRAARRRMEQSFDENQHAQRLKQLLEQRGAKPATPSIPVPIAA